MARFKLVQDHYLFDRLLPAGTTVGDGTPYPIVRDPAPGKVLAKGQVGLSIEMVPLDDEAELWAGEHNAKWRDQELVEPGTGSNLNVPMVPVTINRQADSLVDPAVVLADNAKLVPETTKPEPAKPAVADKNDKPIFPDLKGKK